MVTQELKNFVNFIRTQSVVGLAVGFILGKAISDLVASLVNDIINPIIGLALYRLGDLNELVLHIGNSTISYGKFISILINFIIVAAVVYFGITKIIGKIDKPKN